MIRYLVRRLITDPLALRRRIRLDLRYCRHCWDWTDCHRRTQPKEHAG